MRINSFEDMFSELDRVKLTQYNENGVVPIFGELTHTAARMHYEFICRHARELKQKDYRRDVHKRDFAHWVVEHHAKIGAFVAQFSPAGKVYEIGCGLAIPSLAYSLISRERITAVDNDRVEIQRAQELSKGLDISIEYVVSDAENFINSSGLKRKDVVVVSEAGHSPIGGYLLDWLRRYHFTLVLSNRFPMASSNPESFEDWLQEYVISNEYKVRVGQSKYDKDTMVVEARPGSSIAKVIGWQES